MKKFYGLVLIAMVFLVYGMEIFAANIIRYLENLHNDSAFLFYYIPFYVHICNVLALLIGIHIYKKGE